MNIHKYNKKDEEKRLKDVICNCIKELDVDNLTISIINGPIGEHIFTIADVASFKLVEMPGCCGVLISLNAYVKHNYRGKGLGTALNKYRLDLAERWGYSAIICTDVATNKPQRKILKKREWKRAFLFRNSRTGNVVHFSYKKLNQSPQ